MRYAITKQDGVCVSFRAVREGWELEKGEEESYSEALEPCQQEFSDPKAWQIKCEKEAKEAEYKRIRDEILDELVKERMAQRGQDAITANR